MSTEEARRVFDGFLKTKNEESKLLNPYSNGIGLSLCKQICENLGGTIKVKSTLGRGTTFTFTISALQEFGGERLQDL